MHFTKFLSTLFLMGAVSAMALPDAEQHQPDLVVETIEIDDGNSTEPISPRTNYASVTTWSGNNCRGSSATHSITSKANHCFAIPGHSFNNFNKINNACVLTTWSGNNCRGSSERFQGTILGGSGGCTAIPFGSYTLHC